ncbi:MAG: SUMF1/EgtB/PvdO family nonheme iron enzyme, partial [Chromatiaceae bacterium]
MIEKPATIDEAELARRASDLLKSFFTARPELRQTALDRAFLGCRKDPRGLIDASAAPMAFAVECVSRLLAFGCIDGHRHSLGRLLGVIRDDFLGLNPDPDYFELPRLLDGPCLMPSRDEERAHLGRMLAEIERQAALYAPLRGIARIAPGKTLDPQLGAWDDLALLRHVRRNRQAEERSAAKPFPDILQAFSEVKRAALLGQPGAGKTTTLRKLAADLARRASDNPVLPLPLLVRLGDWTGAEAFETFLAHRLPEVGAALLPLSRAGRLILLLDGLNELPTAKRAEKVVDIRALLATLARDTPVFVSCRSDDYRGELDLGLDTLTLEPLSPERVRDVLREWLCRTDPHQGQARAERLFWHLAGDEALAGVLQTWRAAGADEALFWTAEDIPRERPNVWGKTSGPEDALWQRHVRDPRSLVRLAANPFMLTMLFWVWVDRGETLPRNRGDLFARFVDALLDRERLLRPDTSDGTTLYTPEGERLLSGLTGVAWIMQGERLGQAEGASQDLGVLTVLPREAAVKALGGHVLLKKAEDATLLEGNAEVRFRHQLLQEYFTATAVQSRIEETPALQAAELWPVERWWERSGWEESAVLLAGLHSDDCTPVIRWLRDAQPEVAAQCIRESGAMLADRDALYGELHEAWLPRLTDIEQEPAPEARAAVGRALGRLGLDDRKGVGLTPDGLPDIDWVEIPGGEFVYQDGERRTCEAFRIGRYPITHAQFQAFLDAQDGYSNDRWWAGFEDPDRTPEEASWPIANHPRETVGWFEATAFCAWLSHRLGLHIRLPTEWEWERAARGT